MKKVIIGALVFAPALASAQNLSNLQTLLTSFGNLVDTAIPIVLAIALLAFFWGLAKFIFAAGDEGKKDEGKRIMLWGIVALFVMVAVWGLVTFLGQALGISTTQTTPPAGISPTVPTP